MIRIFSPSADQLKRVVNRQIAKLPNRVKGRLRDIEMTVNQSFLRQFQSEGAEFGAPWKPIKQRTKDMKAAKGLSTRILVRSGRLLRSLTKNNAIGRTVLIQDDTLTIENHITPEGSGVPLLRVHAARKRAVTHAQTGIAGSGLARIEIIWQSISEEIAKELG